MNRRFGFTMVESLVVMTITVIVLTLGLFFKDSLHPERLNQRYFWDELRQQWELSERLSQSDNCATYVTFIPHREVIFESDPSKSGRWRRRILKMPRGLSPSRGRLKEIEGTGHVNQPSPIAWIDTRNHRVIMQRFEIGWGMYRLEEDRTSRSHSG